MASQVITEDFTGSGTLAGTSPGELTGVGATWVTVDSGGSAYNAFTRSGAGATVVLPLDSMARLDPAGPALIHSAGVTVVQASVRPGMQLDVLLEVVDIFLSLGVHPDGSGFWQFDSPASFGSAAIAGPALSTPAVLRIELTDTQARYYVNDALKATHGAGRAYGAAITAIRLGPLATFSNGQAAATTVTALAELQVMTETTSGPLGPAGAQIRAEAASPLASSAAHIGVGRFIQAQAPNPLSAARLQLDHDFTAAMLSGGASEFYVCDLVDGDELTRAPISSWQGTLQLDGAAYLQAVIPAAADMAALIASLSDEAVFVVSRGAMLADGRIVISEMARSGVDEYQLDQGAQRYTCTISGYSAAVTAPVGDGPPLRILRDVRSVSTGSSGVRVRCAIDWFLRPGAFAQAGAVVLAPDWINYYVGGGDAYMDAGERA